MIAYLLAPPLVLSICLQEWYFLNCKTCRYDEKAKYAFVAEFNGEISIIKLEVNHPHKVTALKGHSGLLQKSKGIRMRKLSFVMIG